MTEVIYIYIYFRSLDEGAGGGYVAMPPLFLKSHFPRNAFWEICFCVIIQGIRNIFSPGTPRILSGACMLYGKTVIIWLALAMDIPISP